VVLIKLFLVVRLYNDGNNDSVEIQEFIEFSMEISMLEPNTELITRYNTSISSKGIFWTDSNGLGKKNFDIFIIVN
jgi:hypothetical protein